MIELPKNLKILSRIEKISEKPFLKHEKGSYSITLGDNTVYGERELITTRPSIAVLITHKNEVLMSRQFRYSIFHETQSLEEAFIYETVAGLINKSVKLTVSDEIREETGILLTGKEFDKIRRVDHHYTSPGFTPEKQTLFHVELDRKRYPTSIGLRDEGEFIISKWLQKGEILNLLEGVSHQGFTHRITDAKTRILVKWWLKL